MQVWKIILTISSPSQVCNSHTAEEKKKTQGTLFFFLINGNYGLSYNEISFLYVMLLHLGQSFASSQICWEECSKSAKTSFLHLAFLGIRSINLDNFTFFFFLFRAACIAYGGSQASGQIRATAAGLHNSQSNAGSESRLRPTPHLRATPNS